MPKGGKRAGAGRPKGTTGITQAQTRDKAAMRQALRDVFAKHMDEMAAAQIANAKGLRYLVARNAKTGKFERVTPEMLDNGSEELHERIEVWEKDPSVQAWTDLANRVLDKPAESVDMNVTGTLDTVGILQRARERLNKRG